MLVLVTYDVNTETKEGRRRLKNVALTCKNFGQRVQYSVFECLVTDAQLVRLKNSLIKLIDTEKDSLRFYPLDETARKKIEHHGVGISIDFEGSLQV